MPKGPRSEKRVLYGIIGSHISALVGRYSLTFGSSS